MGSARWECGRGFGRLAGVAVNFFTDDPGGDLVEVLHEGGIQILELRPQHLIDEGFRHTQHHGGDPLAVKTIGLQSVAPAQCEEQLAGPLVGQRELHLGRLIAAFQFGKRARTRSRAASAASFSPTVPAPANSASILRSFSRSCASSVISSSLAQPALIERRWGVASLRRMPLMRCFW